MHLADTILAPATAPGRSALAIIRISGPGVATLLRSHVPGAAAPRRVRPASLPIPSRAGHPIEVPVHVTHFAAPRSYTGEDTLEIQLPGNPHLVERVVAALVANPGVRLAEPGEFSARAYMNGKLSLLEAEGVAATIAARTADQLSAARDLLAGRTGDHYRALADEAATLLALVEAGIDFTDQEDVVAIAPADLARRLDVLGRTIEAHLAGARESADATPAVALVGAPNAGKSTLFNALLGRTRAVAGPIAGTTRDAIGEQLDLSRDCPGAGAVTLLDLPGLDGPQADSAEDPIAPLARAAALTAVSRADLLLWCDPEGRFDGRNLALDPAALVHALRVRTFADRPALRGEDRASIAVCALDGWNLSTLRRAIAERACNANGAGVAALLPRHRLALGQAREALARASADAPAQGPTPAELVAESLREAVGALSELVGTISPDDILGRVFASFCVGK